MSTREKWYFYNVESQTESEVSVNGFISFNKPLNYTTILELYNTILSEASVKFIEKEVNNGVSDLRVTGLSRL